MGLGEFAFSLQMRDTITRMIETGVDRLRPKYRYAIVDSIDRVNYKCNVIYNGEENPVEVSMGSVQPSKTGQVVRIEGIGTDKFITDVIGACFVSSAAIALSTTDLNTVVVDGIYYQSANVNATPVRNYPVQFAGVLEVSTIASSAFLTQRYTTYKGGGDRVFTRSLYSGTWSAWTEVAKVSLVPTGTSLEFAGSVAPAGFLLEDGTAYSRTTYADLFAVIGTTYGAGDGSTTFNVPNRNGRVGVGRDASQTEFNVLGKTGGAKTHTLTIDEMPSHRHSITNVNQGAATRVFTAFGGDTHVTVATGYTNYTGGGGAHNNLQPYIAMNYIIKT